MQSVFLRDGTNVSFRRSVNIDFAVFNKVSLFGAALGRRPPIKTKVQPPRKKCKPNSPGKV